MYIIYILQYIHSLKNTVITDLLDVYVHTIRSMNVCMLKSSFPYPVLGIDIGSSLAEQSHHLRVTIVSSYNQGIPSILSEPNTNTLTIYTYINIHGGSLQERLID